MKNINQNNSTSAERSLTFIYNNALSIASYESAIEDCRRLIKSCRDQYDSAIKKSSLEDGIMWQKRITALQMEIVMYKKMIQHKERNRRTSHKILYLKTVPVSETETELCTKTITVSDADERFIVDSTAITRSIYNDIESTRNVINEMHQRFGFSKIVCDNVWLPKDISEKYHIDEYWNISDSQQILVQH